MQPRMYLMRQPWVGEMVENMVVARERARALVGVVEVVANAVDHQDHLGQQLAVGAMLLDHLPVDEEQLLDLMVIAWHAEADDGHEQLGHGLAVEQQRDERLQPAHLLLHL